MKKLSLKNVLTDFVQESTKAFVHGKDKARAGKARSQALKSIEAYYQGSELSEGEIENLLESKFNHLFSPEDNYSGRFALAKAIISARDKKRKNEEISDYSC